MDRRPQITLACARRATNRANAGRRPGIRQTRATASDATCRNRVPLMADTRFSLTIRFPGAPAAGSRTGCGSAAVFRKTARRQQPAQTGACLCRRGPPTQPRRLAAESVAAASTIRHGRSRRRGALYRNREISGCGGQTRRSNPLLPAVARIGRCTVRCTGESCAITRAKGRKRPKPRHWTAGGSGMPAVLTPNPGVQLTMRGQLMGLPR